VLNNFRNLQSLFWSHGSRWLMYRLGYALRKRTGFIRLQMPAYPWKDRPLEAWLKRSIPSTPELYTQWRKQNSPKFFFKHLPPPARSPGLRERSDERILSVSRRARNAVEGQFPDTIPWNPQSAIDEANRILNGELKYFAHKFVQTGFPPDWHKDPISGKKLDSNKHWSEISDEGDVDIKFIWEASRFSMVYTLVRAYAWTGDEKFAEAFWNLLDSWAESNPPNTGPNWMDGQEAALRLMAWTFGYSQFSNSPSATPQRIAQFTVMVAAHAERIYKNIDYAISTHSNHTISEAFGLWLTGLLFPELRDAEKYHQLGRQLLEQEAAAQIFPDGSYSMYSLNYHRFVLHIYLYAMRLGELNQSQFSNLLFERVSASINFLSQLIDPETGGMPVYGSNDGALVLPLNNCDFTDFRPLLQLGTYLTKKEFLFGPGPWDEDIFWLCGATSLSLLGRLRSAPQGGAGVRVKHTSFPHGGLYLLHNTNSKAVIRCTDFHARPSHADQLHVDLWLRGRNIACDAGTYLYSGEGRRWRNGLAHTPVHNTVTVDHQDQMKMLTRFTWTNWAKGNVLQHDETLWQGEHDGYKRLADPVNHKRTVLSLGEDRWLVVDHLTGKQKHHYALHWLLEDFSYREMNFGVQELAPGDSTHRASELPDSKIFIQLGLLYGIGNFSVVRADPNSTRGWRSRYYGDKEPAISALLETDQSQVCFWTFFGFEGDVLQIERDTFKLVSRDLRTSINLPALVSS
jgi:Heparinase II/III-like protein/Heparinase II/III N-terminus